jgi:AraC-like DNA-binding protein
MIHPVHADLLPLLRNLVEALQPFSAAQHVTLRFEADRPEICTLYHPEKILPDLTQLLCRVVTFTPQEHSVTLRANLLDSPEHYCLVLSVLNTGASLGYLAEITNGMAQPVHIEPLEKPGTAFVWHLPLQRSPQPTEEAPEQAPPRGSPLLKQFYSEMRKRLSSHFSDPVNLERAVNKQHPRDAAFLHKINAVILAHLDRENFCVKQLCKSLALSRTQLYRRLVPIIRQPPARYIRLVRLQKAKEMLETGEMNIGEIATQTGFQSQSHFTRIFTKHYGVRPSAFRRQPKPKT